MSSGINILLLENDLDDEARVREMLYEAKDSEFDIRCLPTLSRALIDERTSDRDLALMEFNLPDSQGVETITSFYEKYPQIPIVVLTGTEDTEICLAAINAGAQEYLVKGKTSGQSLLRVIRYTIQRRRIEATLRQSEEKYKTIVNNIETGVILMDMNMKIVEMNPQIRKWFPGILPELPADCHAFFEPMFGKVHCDKCLCKHSFDGAGRHETIISTTALKHEQTFRVVISPLCGDAKVFSGYIYMLENITDHLHIARQLRQAQKMESLGTLAGGIAHDFNNILTAILGFSQLALHYAPDNSDVKKDLEEIRQAGFRAADLVNQILTFSRQTEKKFQYLRIGIIINEALKLLRSTIPANIEIRALIDNEHFKVLCDPTSVHQIIMNLCTNAAHAMEEAGGVLKIEIQEISLSPDQITSVSNLRPGDHIQLVVSDTGSGIPEDILDSIFDPYFTTKAPREGTGLGLSVVHGIVSDCKGEIMVSSVPGEGTSFTIYLPAEKRNIAPEDEETIKEITRGDEKILFVDDEPMILKLGARLLERHGYEVTTEISSTRALDMVIETPDRFDMVISDLTMPHMTGDTLLVEIMKINPDLPLVLSTGYSKSITESDVQKLGLSAMIKKPFNETELLSTIRHILDHSAKTMETGGPSS